ncbi:MAG: PBP1A family penicillin-binding protein [Lachnospiraceae bacterium]|nr:PBP1A family penicillin-binding protein [Lachnospiraceae bacterium]
MNYSKKGIRKKQKELHSTSGKWGRKATLLITKAFLIGIVALGVIGVSAGIGVFKGILSSAPDISHIDVSPSGFSTFVYDSEGHELTKLVAADSNRIPVTMEQIPEDLAHAFVAIEDERFYEHNGIDIKGIIRAGVIAIKNRDLSQGASTITQQLLKNNVFEGWTSETTIEKIKRKIQEQYLALELEKVMDKDKILENYMNTINLGQNTLGVQAASLRYFGKPVYELKLSECAVIAAITQNPSRYNPISHPEENEKRQKTVLSHMLEQGYITQDEYDEAIADDVYSRIQTVNEESEDDSVYTYFVDALTEDVLNDLVNVAGYNETQAYNLLYSGGLSIYTTQDSTIQSICDEAFSNPDNFPDDTKWYLTYELTVEKANGELENHSSEMFKAHFKEEKSNFNMLYSSQEDAYAAIEAYKEAVMESGDEEIAEKISLTPQPQVSITVEDQNTGYVVAMVGGRGAKEASRTLNRATDTTRQPGSTFKVVSTYAPALDSAGMTLADIENDAPYSYADGRPVSNWYSSGYRGLCSLRDGIRDSLNIVTVKVLTQITPQLGYDYLLNFGFTTLVDRYEVDGKIYSDIQQSLALGGITKGVTNEELNAAYASIANGGIYYKPTLYTKVVDHDGKVILDNSKPQSHRVIKETTAFLLTDAMEDVVTSGTGGSVNFGNMSIAGKTGTTSDYNDVWFSGYTPYYTATTWAGYDNNAKLVGSEKNLAKVLWRAVMSKIHEELPNQSFNRPSGIVSATVCSKSGKLPISGLCDGTLKSEYFAEGTVPTESCDVHYSGMVCAYSMLPASDECPFKVPGTLELIPDDSSSSKTSQAGSDPATDPLQTGGDPTQNANIEKCQHNAEFFLQPNASAVVEQQRLEMQLNALQNGTVLPESITNPEGTGASEAEQEQGIPGLAVPITGTE